MEIQKESQEKHTIKGYDDYCIKINDTAYTQSLIVSPEEIISPWDVSDNTPLSALHIEQLLTLKPEVVLIGSHNPGKYQNSELFIPIFQQHIGVECVSIGAACRTFNILLSEHRVVVAGFILPAAH